jgi:hypothetical protein
VPDQGGDGGLDVPEITSKAGEAMAQHMRGDLTKNKPCRARRESHWFWPEPRTYTLDDLHARNRKGLEAPPAT